MIRKDTKVLQVNKLYYPHIGGVEKHVQDLSEAIKDDVDLRVLVANTTRETVTEKINGVEVIKAASLGMVASAPVAPSLWRWLSRLDSDIYHFHFPYPIGDLSYFLSQKKGKLIVSYHSDIVRQKRLLTLYRPIMNRFLRRADLILAGSPNMIERSPILKDYKDKCRVFHYGIDVKRFEKTDEVKRKAREIRARFKNKKIILFIGRLVYYKGITYLLEAMKTIDAVLLLAGSGGMEGELKEKVKRAGLEDKVIFLGSPKDEELPALYHASDIFVLPSIARSEAFGIVQLEAQACGKPVISTDLPTGVPYANLDMRTGLIVPPEDSGALADAVNRLLEDEILRKKLGIAGKKRVESEFTIEVMKKSVLEAYAEVLTQN